MSVSSYVEMLMGHSYPPTGIDTVFVRGRRLKQDGKLVGIDLAPLFRRGADSRDYLLQQAGKLPRLAYRRARRDGCVSGPA